MANVEHYSTTEYKQTPEYKEFKAETYSRAPEIKLGTKENANTGPESKFTEPISEKTEKQKIKQGESNRNKIKKFFDKIGKTTTSTIGTVAGTIAVAATAVIVLSNVFATPPQVSVNELYTGANFLSYSVQIEDLSDNVDYDIVISNGIDTFTVEEVNEGKNENFVIGLEPDSEYSFSLIENGNAKTTHFSQIFSTKDSTATFMSKDFSANLDCLHPNYVNVFWGDSVNEITFPVGFVNDTEFDFGYRITLIDQNGKVAGVFEGGEDSASIAVATSVETASVTYEQLAYADGRTHVYETVTYQEEILLKEPELILTGEKYYSRNGDCFLPFTINSITPDMEQISEIVFYCNDENYAVDLQSLYENKGIVGLYNLHGVEEFDVYAEITFLAPYGANQRKITSKTFSFKNAYDINDDVYYDVTNNYLYVNVSFWAPEGYYLKIYDNLNNLDLLSSTNGSTHAYVSPTNNQFDVTYGIADVDGNYLSPPKIVKFTIAEVTADYNISSILPSDVLMTVNANDTVNLYFDTNFSCESDPDVFCQITVSSTFGNFYKTSRSPLIAIENIPYSIYNINCSVYKIVDGIKYVLYSSSPSGDISPFSDVLMEAYILDNALSISFYSDMETNPSSTESPIKFSINYNGVKELTIDQFEFDGYSYNYMESCDQPILGASVIVYTRNNYTYETIIQKYGSKAVKGSPYLKYKFDIQGESNP